MRYFLLILVALLVVGGISACNLVPKEQYRFQEGDVLADGTIPEVGKLAYLDDQGLATDQKEDASGQPNEPLLLVDQAKIQELTTKVQGVGAAAPPPWGTIIGVVLGVLGLGTAGAVTIANSLKKKKAGLQKAAEVAKPVEA